MQDPNTTHDATGRRRTPPAERFAVPEIAIDTTEIAETLRREDAGIASRGGHHQMTVFRRGPVTMLVFAFDAGGALAEHTANGLVTIHALGGALTVHTPDRDYALRPGMMVVLAPGIPHRVNASEPSEMLLTVHLHTEPAAEGAA